MQEEDKHLLKNKFQPEPGAWGLLWKNSWVAWREWFLKDQKTKRTKGTCKKAGQGDGRGRYQQSPPHRGTDLNGCSCPHVPFTGATEVQREATAPGFSLLVRKNRAKKAARSKERPVTTLLQFQVDRVDSDTLPLAWARERESSPNLRLETKYQAH